MALTSSRRSLLTLLALALAPAGIRAQGAPTLADLAGSLLRVEEAFRARTPLGEQRARIEVGFDEATRRFFFADLAGALRGIDALAVELLPEGTDREGALLFSSLRIEPARRIEVWRGIEVVALRLRSIYEPELEEPLEREAALVLRGDGGELAREELRLSGPERVEAELALRLAHPLEGPGDFRIELVDAAGRTHALARWSATEADPEQSAARSLAELGRLRALPEAERPSERAARTFRARCELLAKLADPSSAALAPLDPVALERELGAELALLREGKDPYRDTRGDTWCVFGPEKSPIPLRLFVPEALPAGERPPLVLALHGAGGNEHLFFEGYGRGLLRELAAQQRFVLASPSSYPFVRSAAAFDALLEELALRVDYDRERVFVIGHSLGAGAAARLARERADRIAKVACVAGGGDFLREGALAPTLLLLPELDKIVPSAPLARAAEKAREAGRPIEIRVLEGRAHTLVMLDAIPLALRWFDLSEQARR